VFCLAIAILAYSSFTSYQQQGPHRLITATQVASSRNVNLYQARLAPPASGIAPTAPPQAPGLVAQTVQVDKMTVNIQPGLYPGQSDAISSNLKSVFKDVLANFDAHIAPLLGHPRIAVPSLEVRFIRDDTCALAGSTYDEARVILVYTCNNIDVSRAVNILAHEYVHQLAYENFGPRAGRSDTMLVEGLATYLAGEYWLGGYSSFHALVRDQRAAGIVYPLNESYLNRDASVMNALYYQWASFIEFLLIDPQYRQHFAALYTTGDTSIGSADYVELYGKPLDELEREWQAWLDTP